MINIPSDVQWAWTIQGARMSVGAATMSEIERIVEKYPEYFPWERKYKEIPESVHKAYLAEKYPPIDWSSKPKGNGIWEMMAIKNPRKRKPSCKTIEEAIAEMFKAEEKRKRRKKREYNKNKKLWDKYYKEYGSEYRGQLNY